MERTFDLVVVGAGRRGLFAALRAKRERPNDRVLVVDAAPFPGGAIRTLRSNGFVLELGPFAFARAELDPILGLLERPPTPIGCAVTTGSVFTGTGLVDALVDPLPVCFPTGAEELIQACRRELGPRLALGRRVIGVTPAAVGWRIELGGESPTSIESQQVVLATPLADASRLMAALDRELPTAADRIPTAPSAFVYLGGERSETRELVGYGIVPADGLDTRVAEMIFCDVAFPGRALPGRRLVRCELRGPAAAQNDDVVIGAALSELRRWAGTTASFAFTRIHRFADPIEDAATVECRVRLQGIAARVPGLTLA